ncbi:MAG: DUF411 domain-containing protein [Gemmatimonadetes bacterium]|nr:DUF411 domain-containing protein [Gemmatimonadota bacterium]NIQ58618.1 DUF411 domain-containing protein [Gemmatimonadota bacterium]NIU78808.1 DUF411 domain-containing protein [Gammaproteobacteria bacterium]NIX47620.1 DUF411 domain-containing protein [Gemmatimonadota bacterium]NIY11983.1 DUF411 domain-containing protein [Gemmatimonadota bacterium]
MGGCEPGADRTADEPETMEVPGPAERTAADGGELVVYKSPTCGCCSAWVDHMRASGYDVEGVDLPQHSELAARKDEHGVPDDLASCHTAVVDGYVIEGHVPAEVVARLLRERPDIRGLAVPGMPIGSPGMEGANPEPYDVIAFDDDGTRSVYERVDPRD